MKIRCEKEINIGKSYIRKLVYVNNDINMQHSYYVVPIGTTNYERIIVCEMWECHEGQTKLRQEQRNNKEIVPKLEFISTEEFFTNYENY